jgi:hypothetical protein
VETVPSSLYTDIERCFELGWTDGLPVVPPTPERVEAMLGDRSADRDEHVAVLEPTGAIATLEKVAANAVMAGCLPSYLGVVEAAVRCVADPTFSLDLIITAVDPMTPLVLVNGPIAGEIGMSGDAGALGPGCRANATIGRALNLCLRNIGGAKPIRHFEAHALDATTIGHPAKFTYCYTENTALSPWPSLAEDRGFAADASVVTVYGADAPLTIADFTRSEPELILRTIAETLVIPGTTNAYFREELWLIMGPEHAGQVAAAGWSKRDVQRFIFETARVEGNQLLGRGLYGLIDDAAPPSWLGEIDPGQPVPIVDSPDRVLVTVAGGPSGGYTSVAFGLGPAISREVQV